MALNQVLEWIDNGGFSYSELIESLELEGYSHEDSVYAVDNCGADWNEEAVESAEFCLSMVDFSKERLIDYLIYEDGYTMEQAEYAASKFDLKSENESNTLHFILNLESNCIHINENCSAAKKILPENWSEIDIPESELGNYYNVYWACGKCSSRYKNELPKFD